jgi:hypothetical protein
VACDTVTKRLVARSATVMSSAEILARSSIGRGFLASRSRGRFLRSADGQEMHICMSCTRAQRKVKAAPSVAGRGPLDYSSGASSLAIWQLAVASSQTPPASKHSG